MDDYGLIMIYYQYILVVRGWGKLVLFWIWL